MSQTVTRHHQSGIFCFPKHTSAFSESSDSSSTFRNFLFSGDIDFFRKHVSLGDIDRNHVSYLCLATLLGGVEGVQLRFQYFLQLSGPCPMAILATCHFSMFSSPFGSFFSLFPNWNIILVRKITNFSHFQHPNGPNLLHDRVLRWLPGARRRHWCAFWSVACITRS